MAIMLLPDRTCEGCTALLKRAYGCDARLENGVWKNAAITPVVIDGETQHQCPRRPVLDDPGFWRELFSLYRGFKLGFLADEGAIGSQAARGWKLLSMLDAFVNEAEGERIRQISNKG
jgi:hypothetical protein